MKKRFLVLTMMCLALIGLNNHAAKAAELDNLKLSGDFRMRYQTQDVDGDENPARNRWRIRLRPALEAKVNDEWKVGFGLATGSDDPISTNQTLENEFQSPDIRLDYAYAQYSPNKVVKVSAGKLKNPLWTTKDLLWDGDARPDGFAAAFNYDLSDSVSLFITPAYFILDEDKTTENDPAMMALQPGVSWKINDNVNFKIAGAYYDFQNVKGSDMSVHSQGTNSTDADGLWLYEMDSTSVETQLSVKMDSFIKYVAVFGEYVQSDADEDNTGWLAGLTFGDEKVSDLGNWQVTYNIRNLEKDAWVDWLPDSDFYDGETGVEGGEFEFTLGISKSVTFGIDYYSCKHIDDLADDDLSLVQADLVFKF